MKCNVTHCACEWSSPIGSLLTKVGAGSWRKLLRGIYVGASGERNYPWLGTARLVFSKSAKGKTTTQQKTSSSWFFVSKANDTYFFLHDIAIWFDFRYSVKLLSFTSFSTFISGLLFLLFSLFNVFQVVSHFYSLCSSKLYQLLYLTPVQGFQNLTFRAFIASRQFRSDEEYFTSLALSLFALTKG